MAAAKRPGNIAAEIVSRLISYIESNSLDPVRLPPTDKPIVVSGKGSRPETLVLLLSDLQAGHKTKSFNFSVLKDRIKLLVECVLRITAMHRNSHDVRNLEIFMLGDMIHGERVGKTVGLDELEDVVAVQIFDVVGPALTWAISELAQHFETINVRCVRGNHGTISKENAESSNWDDVVYKFLEEKFREVPNVEFSIAKHFYQFVDIEEMRFLLVHGDQIKMHLNIPMYGITQKGMRWQQTLGPFDVMTMGHFHSFNAFDWNNMHVMVNGTFVTDDEWVAKVIGMAGSCSQTLFGVHPEHGITFTSQIRLS